MRQRCCQSLPRVVIPGSVIVSDEWATYRGIPNLSGNYRHETVNYSWNFVDPITGAHTNNVKSYWKQAKAIFKRMKGTFKEMVPSYLGKFIWRERYGSTQSLAFINIMCHIAEHYPC